MPDFNRTGHRESGSLSACITTADVVSPKTLIICPLRKEWDALIDAFRSNGSRLVMSGSESSLAVDHDLGVALAVGGHGKVDFAIRAHHLLTALGGVSELIVAGVAGSLSQDVVPGAVVVGTETVEHDYKGRFSGDKPAPRFQSSRDLVDAFSSCARGLKDLTCHLGPIASGDEDVVTTERADQIRELTGGLCVAWEGAGGARVARFSEISFIEIRAISDYADPDAARHYRENLPTAMGNLGKVLLSCLTSR